MRTLAPPALCLLCGQNTLSDNFQEELKFQSAPPSSDKARSTHAQNARAQGDTGGEQEMEGRRNESAGNRCCQIGALSKGLPTTPGFLLGNGVPQATPLWAEQGSRRYRAAHAGWRPGPFVRYRGGRLCRLDPSVWGMASAPPHAPHCPPPPSELSCGYGTALGCHPPGLTLFGGGDVCK